MNIQDITYLLCIIFLSVSENKITKEYSKNKFPILDWSPKALALGVTEKQRIENLRNSQS